jgi:hypothetical protein
MKITKSQIIEIADTIKTLPVSNCSGVRVIREIDILEAFADMIAASNPAFKRQLFLDYINGKCGPNGGKV